MHVDVDSKTRKKWTNLVDSIAAIVDVPAVLIMHMSEPHIEVFTSSNSDGNPYTVGDK